MGVQPVGDDPSAPRQQRQTAIDPRGRQPVVMRRQGLAGPGQWQQAVIEPVQDERIRLARDIGG